jgi:hypothetical protein
MQTWCTCIMDLGSIQQMVLDWLILWKLTFFWCLMAIITLHFTQTMTKSVRKHFQGAWTIIPYQRTVIPHQNSHNYASRTDEVLLDLDGNDQRLHVMGCQCGILSW